MNIHNLNIHLRRGVVAVACLAVYSAQLAQASSIFGPGDLLVSRTTYTGMASTVTFPNGLLPNNAASVANGTFPHVFDNETPDGSFGVTSPIFIDQMTRAGALISTIPLANHVFVPVSTSFPSKSELGLSVTPDGNGVTFMAYGSTANALDVSNANTPGHVDITNPVNGQGILINQRDIVELSATGAALVTTTNTYSGNNGRNVVLGDNGNYYTVGNAGNNGKSVTLPPSVTFASGTVTLSSGSTAVVLSGASTTAGLFVGGPFSGTKVPPGAYIAGITDATHFTISASATGLASGKYLAATGAVTLTSGSPTVVLSGASTAANLYVGTPFSGTSVPTGAYITGITDATHFTISANASGAASGFYTANAGAVQLTGVSFAKSATTITVTDTSKLVLGMPLTGTGATGSYILAVTSATTFTVNPATTAASDMGSYTAAVSNSMLSDDTGVQMIQKFSDDTTGTGTGILDAITHSTVVGKVNGTYGTATGYQRGFTIMQIGAAADKTGKDDNYRGLRNYSDTLYVSKGSGGNGFDAVYQVNPSGLGYVAPGTSAGLPTSANATTASINPLPGWPLDSTGANESCDPTKPPCSPTTIVYHPFGIWFANDTTLYVADEGSTSVTNAAAGGLEKWTYSAGTWHLRYTLAASTIPSYSVGTAPNVIGPLSAVGLRNIAGFDNGDGTVTIFGITSTGGATLNDEGADPNQLVSITDTVAATSLPAESFTVLETAAYGDALRGVALIPRIAPTVTFTGAPASAAYGSTFNVSATTNASTTATITASGACSVSGNTVTMDSSTGTCNLTATWAGDGTYNPATANQSTAAIPAVLTVTANNVSRPYGTPNPTLTATITGFVHGDNSSVVSGSPLLTTTATISSLPGGYPITVALGTLAATNYTFTPVNGALTVEAITPASLISLVGQFLAAGSIDNGGIANSLTSKLSAAAQQIANGNNNAAINQLNALINELNAQDGKHISQQANALLQAGVLYLINSL